jgi:hypothetical protein
MIESVIKKPLDAIEDTTDLALDVARNELIWGGIAGVVAGAAIGRIIEPRLTFSGRFTNMGGAVVEFLLGAALYGVGLTGRVQHAFVRSGAQVAGVVIAGMGLGRILSSIGAPSFGLGAEDMMGLPDPDDGRVIGQDYNGRQVGQAAEDEDGETHDASPSHMTPLAGASRAGFNRAAAGQPWQVAENWDIMSPSAGVSGNGVEQWYGSAESFRNSPRATFIGNMVSSAEGLGSVIGQ